MSDQLQTSVPEVNNPPDLEGELSQALDNHFNEPQKPEVKQNEEKTKQDNPLEQRVEESVKEQRKTDAPMGDTKAVEQTKLLGPDEADAINQKDKGSWGILKNNYKRSLETIKKTTEEKDIEITKLKASLAEKESVKQKEIESLKNEKQELSKYRAMVDIQSDPEFVSKFDKPINEKVSSMKELLKGWNVDEATINSINFLDKNTVGLIAKTLRKGEEHISSEFELEEFMSNAKDVLELSKKRDKELKNYGDNYKELIEAKKKESFSKGAEEEGRSVKHLETIAQSKDKEGNTMFPFLNKMQPKDNAGQPEIDQINNHNKMVDMMNEKVKSALNMKTPEERAEVAVAAAAAHYLSAQLKFVMAKNKSLEEELKKISTVSSETEKVKRNGTAPKNPLYEIDSDTAISEHFGRR